MRIARTRNLERSIGPLSSLHTPNFNTTIDPWNTKRLDGSSMMMADISPSPMDAGLDDCGWLETRNRHRIVGIE
jgi:hypothetical protein